MNYILWLISLAALVFGNDVTQKAKVPRGVCADCNCNGPRGDRGEIGRQGVIGQPGKQGPDGFPGHTGEMHADVFYGTFELDPFLYEFDVDVALNFTTAIHGFAFAYTRDTVVIQEAGTFQCWYSANTYTTVKVYMTVNGVPALNNTVFGQDVDEANSSTVYSNFYGQAILPLQLGDVVQVRMYSSGLVSLNENALEPTLTMIKLTHAAGN